MPNCYVCRANFASLKVLTVHFKFAHNLHVGSNYRCGELSCCRDFGSLKAFKKHFIRMHSDACLELEGVDNGQVCESTNSINLQTDQNNGNSNDTVEDSSALSNDYCDADTFKECLQRQAMGFVAKLYSNMAIPRSQVQMVIEDTTEFLGGQFLSILKDKVVQSLTDLQSDPIVTSDVAKMFESLENPFSGLNTEYRRFQAFESSGFYIPPVDYILGSRLNDSRTREGSVELNMISVKAKFVPLRSILKKIFELPGVLDNTIAYMKSLPKNPTTLTNFVQGELWLEKTIGYNGTVIPLFVYFDDFEAGNPLGSHSGIHKVGAVYTSIPCFPPEVQSMIDNIFLTLLFHSSDRKYFGNRATFNILIQELKFLQTEGITVDLPGGITQKLFFVMGLIIGDNLGVNEILGLTSSFSANYCCRFCKVHKQLLQTQPVENVEFLRTKENYALDLSLKNVSLTGVVEECIWHEIPGFHLTENFSVDIMHDLFEGVCKYDMTLILKYLIFDASFFSMDMLNARLKSFSYSDHDNHNKPPMLSVDNIMKRNLRMSASETICFVRNFSLLIGDFVPKDNDVWEFYISLRQILDIVTSDYIQLDSCQLLTTLISEHNSMYISLFGDSLKPKHHFLVHYPRIIQMVGPLKHIWSMRNEAKHRDFKKAASSIYSRVNICHSLAVRSQLKFAERLISQKGVTKEIEIGTGCIVNVSDMEHFELFSNSLPPGFRGSVFSANWVIKRIHLKIGCVVIISLDDECAPLFGVIRHIFVDSLRNVLIVLSHLITVGFDEHYHAFEVLISETSTWSCVTGSFLIISSVILLPNGRRYVPLRHCI